MCDSLTRITVYLRLMVLCERLDWPDFGSAIEALTYYRTLITRVAYRGCPFQAYPKARSVMGQKEAKGIVFFKIAFVSLAAKSHIFHFCSPKIRW